MLAVHVLWVIDPEIMGDIYADWGRNNGVMVVSRVHGVNVRLGLSIDILKSRDRH